jgi:hypothetical protein
MQRRTITRPLAALAAAAAVLTPPAVAGAQAAPRAAVHGSWMSLVNCAATGYDPVSKRLTCVGSTLWQGTWNGVTDYVGTATYDALSGDASGTLTETFHGRASDGGRGTLTFFETFTIDGATSALHIDAQLLDGSGDFTGARGEVSFDGVDNIAAGNGTYAGWWAHR